MSRLEDAQRVTRFFQLLVLASATFAATYSRSVLGPIQESMRLSLGLSDNDIAWLQGPAIAVPMALGAIPIGLLVDRYPRARMFLLFAALALLSAVLTAASANASVIFAGRCLAGFTTSAILITTFSILGDLYGPAQRGRATMVTAFGDVGGAPAAFALGGLLLALHGASIGSEIDGWRWALMWMCIPLVLPVLLMFALREPARTGVIVKNLPMRDAWRELWRYRAIIAPMLLARVMVWIADGAAQVWAAPNLARNYALPPDQIGAIMATALLTSGVLGPVLGGLLADACQRSGGSRRTMTGMSIVALLSIPAAFFATMPGVPLASTMLAVFLTLGFTIGTASLALGIVVIPGELRGLYVAVNVTLAAIFTVGLAPLAVSGLSTWFGGPAMIGKALAAVCVFTSVLGTFVFGFGRRSFSTSASVPAVGALS